MPQTEAQATRVYALTGSYQEGAMGSWAGVLGIYSSEEKAKTDGDTWLRDMHRAYASARVKIRPILIDEPWF